MRRRFQFTLRFVLLGMAILAIPLGIYVNRFQRQRRFVAAIEERDGIVFYVIDQKRKEPWKVRLSGWLGEATVFPIQQVIITGIHDDDLAIFNDARDLQELSIFDAKLTSDGIARLSTFKNLRRLHFEGGCASVRDLDPLTQLSELSYLYISVNGGAAECEYIRSRMPNCHIGFGARDPTLTTLGCP